MPPEPSSPPTLNAIPCPIGCEALMPIKPAGTAGSLAGQCPKCKAQLWAKTPDSAARLRQYLAQPAVFLAGMMSTWSALLARFGVTFRPAAVAIPEPSPAPAADPKPAPTPQPKKKGFLDVLLDD